MVLDHVEEVLIVEGRGNPKKDVLAAGERKARNGFILIGHTMGTPEYSLASAFELFAEIGLDGAEVVYQAGYGCGIDEGWTPDELRDLSAYANRLGVPVIALTPYFAGFSSLDESERTASENGLLRCVDAAALLGARYIRVYAGKFLSDGSYTDAERQRQYDRLVESLRRVGGQALLRGVLLVVENHFNTAADTAGKTLELVQAVGVPSVRILYDPANLGFLRAEPPEQAIAVQREFMSYVHVKDFVFKPQSDGRPYKASSVDHASPSERVVTSRIPGEGCLDWRSIVALLAKYGLSVPLSLEYERRWHPEDLPDAAEGMRRGAGYIRRLLAEIGVC